MMAGDRLEVTCPERRPGYRCVAADLNRSAPPGTSLRIGRHAYRDPAKGSTSEMPRFAISVDTGGTFVDFVL
jgi:hypothetical protein